MRDAAHRQPVPVVVVLLLGDRLQQGVVRRESSSSAGSAMSQVVIASSLGQQPAGVVVDREHLLARGEFGRGAPRGIRDVLPFGEVVGQARSIAICTSAQQAVVDPGVQRPREQHVDQAADDDRARRPAR